MRRFLKFLLITLGVVAVGALGVGGWKYHKYNQAMHRRDELLKDFIRVSDDFTVPKLYANKQFRGHLSGFKSFLDINHDDEMNLSLWGTCVNSDGMLKLGRSLRSYFIRPAQLDVNVNDTIFLSITDSSRDETLTSLATLLASAESGATLKIKCRVKGQFEGTGYESSSNFILEGDDKEAFMRMIELADILRRLR